MPSNTPHSLFAKKTYHNPSCEKPMIKVSLRSVGSFPCNKLAAEFFNGGGHLNASGGEFYGTMEEARQRFEQALESYKPLLTASKA